METDSSLVARILAGDDEAYATLLERHRPKCFRYAVRFLGDIDDAEDVVQQTFVRAYRSLDRCTNADRFGSWLMQILVNRCRSAYESRTRRERWFTRANMDDQIAPHIESSAEAEAVQRAITQLSADHREALLLKFVEEMTYDQMAAVTGLSPSAVKMRVSRASQALRSRLFVEK